jgi:hypothetical protein
VDYEKYGEFVDPGTRDYKYVIKSQDGLSEAVGEGIYPNTTSVRWDPAFQQVKKEKRLEGSHWDFVRSPDLEAAFIKWAMAPEPPGIRQYYTAVILEKSGLIKHAIKAYYAVVVNFPQTGGGRLAYAGYVGRHPSRASNIFAKNYPQVNMKLVGASSRSIRLRQRYPQRCLHREPGRIVKKSYPETISDKVRSMWI